MLEPVGWCCCHAPVEILLRYAAMLQWVSGGDDGGSLVRFIVSLVGVVEVIINSYKFLSEHTK